MLHAEQPSTSNNYTLKESSLGQGGRHDSDSANYRATTSTDDLGIGNSSSSNYRMSGGSQTTADPRLVVTVNPPSQMTTFHPSTASTGSSTFSVINYTSHGYTVHIAGDTLRSGGHALPAMTAANTDPGALSSPGTEQFGINLTDNSSPNVGADPTYGYFASGTVDANYNNPDHFRFVSGEAIAGASENSGETTYTLSYLANVKPLTPGGTYTTDLSIIVTGTY